MIGTYTDSRIKVMKEKTAMTGLVGESETRRERAVGVSSQGGLKSESRP